MVAAPGGLQGARHDGDFPSCTLRRVMELRQGQRSLPLDTSGTAVAVGFFDGVHRGHQLVLRRTVDAARAMGLEPVALTFDRHPREVVAPGTEPGLLTTTETKVRLIGELGLKYMVVLEFTEEFSRWPPERFVERILAKNLSTRVAVVGSNFTFGDKATGKVADLRELGHRYGLRVHGVDLLEVDGRPVSSSSIRQALEGGDLQWPRKALGRPYLLEGKVRSGAGRGRQLGFPTANLDVPARMLLPGRGVYAGKAHVEGRTFLAAVNVGSNPTFSEEPVHLEAYLLDFRGDLLGQTMGIEFWERLRDEERFPTPAELVGRMHVDVSRTRELFGEAQWR